MFYSVLFDALNKRIITTWGRVATDAALIAYQKEVWLRPDVQGYDELFDVRDIEEMRVSTDGLRELAALSADMDDPAKVSKLAVIADTPLSFGLARMYEAFRELDERSTRHVHVFRDMEHAVKWLSDGALDA